VPQAELESELAAALEWQKWHAAAEKAAASAAEELSQASTEKDEAERKCLEVDLRCTRLQVHSHECTFVALLLRL